MELTPVNDLFARIQHVSSEHELIDLSHEFEEMVLANIITDNRDIMILQLSMLNKATELGLAGIVQMIEGQSTGSPKRDEMH